MPDAVSAPVSPLLNGEKLLSLSALAARLPGHRGKPTVNPSTIFRWITRGVRTPDGEVVRLEAVRLGTSWRTSLEAITRFSAKLTSASLCSGAPPDTLPPTPKQRNRAATRASRRLDSILGTG